MIKKIVSFTIVLYLLSVPVLAQTDTLPAESWDAYLAQFKKKPGSVSLNMALKKVAPLRNYPFVIITGVRFKDCTSQGLPSQREFTNLYKLSDSVNAVIGRSSASINSGSFTYLCERLEYFYVTDTTWIRMRLAMLYKNKFPGYNPVIEIKKDSAWTTYLKFLYPKDETLEIMANQKILSAMQKAGDKLSQARMIDHWAYFKSEADRNCFLLYATKKKFIITAKGNTNDYPGYPFKLTFSQQNRIDLSSISKLTFELRRQAALCYGNYDGWETIVIK